MAIELFQMLFSGARIRRIGVQFLKETWICIFPVFGSATETIQFPIGWCWPPGGGGALYAKEIRLGWETSQLNLSIRNVMKEWRYVFTRISKLILGCSVNILQFFCKE